MAKEELTLLKKLSVKYTLHHLGARYNYLNLILYEHEFNKEVREWVEARAESCLDKLSEVTIIVKERFGDRFNKDIDELKIKFWGLIE